MPSRRVPAVRIDVAAVEGGDGVAAVDRLLQRPDVDLLAAAGVGRPVVLDAGVAYIQTVGRRTAGSATTAWLPQKFMPTKTGAGPLRLFGTTSSRWIGGVRGGPKEIVISFSVALPPNAFGSVARPCAVTLTGGGR